MGTSEDFYLKRRSVIARKMLNKPIPVDHLDKILAAGIRVPDHGALNPWKIKVITGDKLKKIDEEIILSEFKLQNPNANEFQLETESKRLQRASVVLAVISSPFDHPSIPEWEMRLSAGAVCMNLLSCSQSLGYAAQWLTEWYAYNNKMIKFLGGEKASDQIAGFIYIGHKSEEPNERRRPDPANVIEYI
tara:strand:- start:116 stop:685 length:570 start_codon:yes stop_codon:yes gene_type:complete